MEPNNEGGNNMTTMVVVSIAIIIAVLGGIYILNSQQSTSTQDVMEEGTDKMENEDKTMDGMDLENVQTVTLEGGSFYYEPNQITVKKGATVKVVLNSVDMEHDFVIDELGVSMPIVKSGDSGEVTFVADTPGEYEFYCSVSNHRQQGMTGTLIVEE